MVKVACVLIGMFLSGLAAVVGIGLGGYKSDFDLIGMIVFVAGALIVPPVVAVGTLITAAFLVSRENADRLSVSLSVLLVGPLVALVVAWTAWGYMVDQSIASHAKEKEDYHRYTNQIAADPGIVLRERWFERDPALPRDASLSRRQRVFEDSLNQRLAGIEYSPEQLREIYQKAPAFRLSVAAHPRCPPELIEEIWPEATSADRFMEAARIIENPATPMHLIEAYEKKRIEEKRPVSGTVDGAVRDRLKAVAPDAGAE